LKIVHINLRYYPQAEAGPAISTQELAEESVRQGHHVSVICINQKPTSSVEQLNGVTVYRLSNGNSTAALASEIDNLFSKLEPEIVHSHWIQKFPILKIAAAAKSAGAKLVHTLREYGFLCGQGTLYRPGTGPCQHLCADCGSDRRRFREYSEQINGVIAVSQFCLDVHLRADLFSKTKVMSVVHNSYLPPSNQRPKKTAGRCDEITRLGYLGRFATEKGIIWLMQRLESTGLWKRTSLTIASKVDAEIRQKIESQFPNLAVQWLGFIEPTKLFEKIDWLVVPSMWHEAFGRIVIEAYGHGTPVLATNLGALPDLVKHEVTGRIYSPFLKEKFEQQLNWIVDHREQWEKYASNAWEQRKHYLPEKLTQKTIELYRQLL